MLFRSFGVVILYEGGLLNDLTVSSLVGNKIILFFQK